MHEVNALDLREAEFAVAVRCVTDGIFDIHTRFVGYLVVNEPDV
jgi:hypothetical protein